MAQDDMTPPGTGDNTTTGPGNTGPGQTGSDRVDAGATVVPFRRPEPTGAIEGEVVENGTGMAVSDARETWGTRVLHGTGRVLAGPSDETRAKLAEATVDAAHHTASRIRTGTVAGARVAGRVRRFTSRNARIIGKGMDAARQRHRADRGHTDLKTARRAASEKGDHAAVEALTKQHNDARHVTVDTLTKWAGLVWDITWRGAAAIGVLFVVSVIVGLVNGFGSWLGEFGALTVLGTWRDILAAVWAVGVFVVTWWWAGAALAGLVKVSRWWRDGNRLGEQVLPAHLRKLAKSGGQVVLSESAMVAALANIGNPKLNSVIKAGWPNRDSDNPWVQFPMVDGKGWSTKIRLPLGAPVIKIQERAPILAHNLGCRPVELFLRADSEDPQVLDLFRLDRGVLAEPVAPYPLLHEGVTDYWQGFPVGVNLRGEPITADMVERTFAFAGKPGSGKSTLMMTTLTGAILDPVVDVDVFVFADNNDYEAFGPCLNTYAKGAGDDDVAAAIAHLEDLYADLSVRGKLLQKHNVDSVWNAGRDIVAREPGLRPRFVVLEECQALFRQDDPAEKKRVVNLAIKLFMAARKYAVHMAFLTPSPSADSLPRDIMATVTNKACGSIDDKTRNNVVLGEGAHERGLTAIGLEPRTKSKLNDCGTMITVGWMDEPGALRSYHLKPHEREAVVARAAQARGITGTATALVAARDVLADMLTVLAGMTPREGETHPRAAALAAGLAARWNDYTGWSVQRVVETLAQFGYKVPTTHRTFPVDPVKVADTMTARDASPVG